MIFTLIPIRPFYQTSGGVRSVGNGRLHMRPPAGYDHIRKVTLSQKKTKMSETARAVGRERTTSILAYIGFRPSWSSNVELILRWDACVVIMKDIIYKCYRSRAESDTLRFTAYDKMASSRRPSRPDQTIQNMDYIRSHGIRKEQIMSLQ